MPSTPSLGRWQVKSDRRFLTTTEVLPSSDWCSKQVIQVVAATSQRLSQREQNRIRFDQRLARRFLLPWYRLQQSAKHNDLCFQPDGPPHQKTSPQVCSSLS